MPMLPTSPDDRLQRIAALARYGTLLLLAGFFVATHIPIEVIPRQVHVSDKIAHCLAYMLMTTSTLASWELSTGLLRPQHYFLVWLVGTIYGAFDEVTQIPVGRHCDGLDWFSDILGIVLGLTLYRLARPLVHRLVRFKVALN